jgi:hypothetical protein
MLKLITFLLAATTVAAGAHPSLMIHDHPHGVMALAGLDMLLVAAFITALVVAAFKRARS